MSTDTLKNIYKIAHAVQLIILIKTHGPCVLAVKKDAGNIDSDIVCYYRKCKV